MRTPANEPTTRRSAGLVRLHLGLAGASLGRPHPLGEILEARQAAIRLERARRVGEEYGEITIRDGKGSKDRVTMFPESVKPSLQRHLNEVKRLHDKCLAGGNGRVYMPYALDRT